MPLTVATREKSVILGGPGDDVEVYDLDADPHELTNLAETGARADSTVDLLKDALAFLVECETEEALVAQRRAAVEALRSP
jgi:hypothetical protein